MFDFLSGLRHGVRAFTRAPGFAAIWVTILATGIGASTLMYTLVQSVLFRELPFLEPEPWCRFPISRTIDGTCPASRTWLSLPTGRLT